MSKNDFQGERLKGLWSDLQEHIGRNAVILVDPDLDLSAVADAVSEDKLTVVKAWLRDRKLQNPSLEQLRSWDQTPSKEFYFVIVQPYVLIQALSH